MAPTYVYLASDDARMMTGAELMSPAATARERGMKVTPTREAVPMLIEVVGPAPVCLSPTVNKHNEGSSQR